ncbi:SnRNP core Sm protein Sm-X5-like protein [Zea mays]|uniref:SnRNP core Sm protein Sm-X5-like protein n=1 Tax=Zea mays TaxID=4577 RepID=A0A1D6J0C4_MAIZE|nr:SnRNP core Sm protein Sm-X5-like protein [Zea mays]
MAYPAEAAPNPSTRDPARGREGGRVEMAYPAETTANPSTRDPARGRARETLARGAARANAPASELPRVGSLATERRPKWPYEPGLVERWVLQQARQAPTPTQLSVRNCFIRGSVVRYVLLPQDGVDVDILHDATRREARGG